MAISRRRRKHLFWLILMLTSIGFSAYMVFGEGGYLRLREFRSQLDELRAENSRLKESVRQLEVQLHRLKTEPEEIERIAREQYNLARPGDIIVNVPEDSN
jgi:cell division protein FtsB